MTPVTTFRQLRCTVIIQLTKPNYGRPVLIDNPILTTKNEEFFLVHTHTINRLTLGQQHGKIASRPRLIGQLLRSNRPRN